MEQEFFDQPKQQKLYPKMTVEECYSLSIGSLSRNLLHPNKEGESKSGKAYISSQYDTLLIGYKVIKSDPFKVQVIYPYKGIAQTQVITILTCETHFGNKPFFFCVMCGSLRSKLYLRPDRKPNYFSCRKCLELSYELQTINRRGGVLAEMAYRMNRAMKVSNMLKHSKRRVYGNKVAKPFLRWIVAKQKWLGSEAAEQTYEKLSQAKVKMS